jgi:acetyltransferase-like isoleucine patch superfamily enzyme
MLCRRAARKAGLDPGTLLFGAGRPRPQFKNEQGAMRFGRICVCCGCRIWAHKGGKISIEDGTFLDEGVEIIAWEQVHIGEGCYIGMDALIMDTDLHSVGGRPVENRPVEIGDEVRIGPRAMVLKGVTVGPGAVIRPGAIVTRDVPANSEVIPQPARTVR